MQRCIEMLGSPEKVLFACETELNRTSVKETTTAAAIKEFLDERINIDQNENSVRAYRNILYAMECALQKERPVDIDFEDTRKWFHSLNFKAVTLHNYKTKCSVFMNWCIERKYARENPFKNTPIPKVIRPDSEIITPNESMMLLDCASTKYKDALAYLSLQSFAGMRSSACPRLGKKGIKFEERGILVEGTTAVSISTAIPTICGNGWNTRRK